jgi:hypothetical protein
MSETGFDGIRLAEILGEIKSDIRNVSETLRSYKGSMDDLDERLRKVENAVESLKAAKQEAPKPTPWHSTVGAVVGIISGLGSLVALIAILGALNSTP